MNYFFQILLYVFTLFFANSSGVACVDSQFTKYELSTGEMLICSYSDDATKTLALTYEDFQIITINTALTEKGFNPLHSRKTALTDGWGETGIDGVFVKDGQYYIVEAKYHGQATLTPANHATGLPKQMSDDWILTDNRILNAVGGDVNLSNKITNSYRRILAEVAPDGTVIYKELDASANVIGTLIS
jgi:hypothetical protein